MQHGDTKYDILKECAQTSGWLIVDEEQYAQVVKSRAQTIKWSDWPTRTKKINRNHKCNCMPGIRLICDKEKLSDLVESIRGEFEDDMLRFVPRSWSLPRDMQSFSESFRKNRSIDDSQNPGTSSDFSDLRDRDNIASKNGKNTLTKRRKDKWFIVKPSKGLQGRGIHISCSLNQIEKIIRATPVVCTLVCSEVARCIRSSFQSIKLHEIKGASKERIYHYKLMIHNMLSASPLIVRCMWLRDTSRTRC